MKKYDRSSLKKYARSVVLRLAENVHQFDRDGQSIIINGTNGNWVCLGGEGRYLLNLMSNSCGMRLQEMIDSSISCMTEEAPLTTIEKEELMLEVIGTLLEKQILLIQTGQNYVSSPKRSSLDNVNIAEVTWSLSGSCNLSCMHCYRGTVTKKEVPPATSKEIEDKILAFICRFCDHAYLTGGEPFLHTRILFFIEQLADKLDCITILTNGTLIDESIAEAVAAYRKKVVVQISLDSPRKECHEKIRGKNSYDATIRAIELLRSKGVEVIISMVPMKQNIGQLDELIALGERLGVKQLHFPLLDITGNAEKNKGQVVPDLNDLCRFYGIVRDYTLSGKISNGYTRKLCEKFGQPPVYTSRNCGLGNSLFIDHVGNVYPCSALYNDAFISGNVLQNDIEDIFLNSQKLWQVRDVCPVQESLCSKCAFQAYCTGGCRARALHTTGSIEGQDPYCEFYKRHYEGFLWSEVDQAILNDRQRGMKT